MEKYIKELINRLAEKAGYGVMEIKGFAGLSSDWCAAKRFGSGMRVFVFSEPEKLAYIDEKQIAKSIMEQTGALFTEIIVVCIVSGSHEETQRYSVDEKYKLIAVDRSANKIPYFSGVDGNAVAEIATALDYMAPVRKGKKRHGTMQGFMSEYPVTFSLIAINVMAYLLTAFLSHDIINSNINVLVFLGGKVDSLIAQGEYYRLITCMFLHGGIIHLAFNMYALYAIGPVIEKFFGHSRYFAIYMVSGLCSSLLSFFMSPGISIGASGAIFGILGACLVFAVKMKNRIGREFLTNIVMVIAINLFIGFSTSFVDNFGHLGGLAGGILSSLILFKRHGRN